jgi:hypothetical protein
MEEVGRLPDGIQKVAEQDPPVSAQYLKPRYAGLFLARAACPPLR